MTEIGELKPETLSTNEFDEVCRCCLSRKSLVGNITSVRMDQIDSNSNSQLTMADLYQSFCKIKINPMQHLPMNICEDCVDILAEIKLFEMLCTRVEDGLQKYEAKMQGDRLRVTVEPLKPVIPVEEQIKTETIEISETQIKTEPLSESTEFDDFVVEDSKPLFSNEPPPETAEKRAPVHRATYYTDHTYCYPTFPCETCDAIFRTARTLGRHKHRINHYDPGETVCYTCAKTFRRHRHLRRHVKSHFPVKSCRICGVSFLGKGGLQRHKRMMHPRGGNPHTIKCEFCKHLRFKSNDTLIVHVRKYHKDAIAEIICGRDVDCWRAWNRKRRS